MRYILIIFIAFCDKCVAIPLTDADKIAIFRVAHAEAANQGSEGISAVMNVIINRLQSGQWGASITEVLNSPNQFEPVHKVGGWQYLPNPSKEDLEHYKKILNDIISGSIVDPTQGALYFQNPTVVAQRESEGSVSEGLTHFGGSQPTVIIGDHAFYRKINMVKSRSIKNSLLNRRLESNLLR